MFFKLLQIEVPKLLLPLLLILTEPKQARHRGINHSDYIIWNIII